jgi:ABC-type antimicrobial peptide transport system permease subunit
VTTLGAQVASTIVTERLLSDIGAASAFAGLAIGLVGLFGLLNYVVTERTPEIGIRMALGAARRGVYVLVLREAAGPVLFGLLAGAVASLLTLRWSRSLLFDVSASDVRVVALALGAFLGAALVACAIPARRAAAIDPIVAVRHK